MTGCALAAVRFVVIVSSSAVAWMLGGLAEAALVCGAGVLILGGFTVPTLGLVGIVWWQSGWSTLLLGIVVIAVLWGLFGEFLILGVNFAIEGLGNRLEERDARARTAAAGTRRRIAANSDAAQRNGLGYDVTVAHTIPIFISSSFRDFHAERDLIAGPVRERLSELAATFGCRVEIVDLRWGVDTADLDDDERHERVLEVCLAEIDRCRPFFVGLIGERAGWRPSMEQLDRVMVDAGMDTGSRAMSMTALEIEYGANGAPDARAAFFSRRIDGPHPPGWADDDQEPLQLMRASLPAERVHEYVARADGEKITDLGGLETILTRELGAWVTERGRERRDGSRVDARRVSEALFFDAHRTGYATTGDEVEHIAQLINDGTSVCLVGRSGSGKSSLWCAALDRCGDAQPHVAAHAVGIAPDSSDHDVVVRELMSRLGFTAPQLPELHSGERMLLRLFEWAGLVEPPGDIRGNELLGSWRDLLSSLAQSLVAIDGLDRLDAGAARGRLDVLSGLPDGAVALVSTSAAADAQLLRSRGFHIIELHPYRGSTSEQMVAAIAAARHRQLSSHVTASLVARPRSPLWLRLAIDDLAALRGADFVASDSRGEDSPELMLQRIAGELPEDEVDLVVRSIQRAEARLGSDVVKRYLALNAATRLGFTPGEFRAMLQVPDLEIAGLRRSFAELLVPVDADDRLKFRNEVVREAARRYVADAEQDAHRLAITRLRSVRVRSDITELELLHHTLNCPELAADVLPVLFPKLRPTFSLGVAAQQLIVETIHRQRPGTAALDGFSAALAREEAQAPSALRRWGRRVLGVQPTTGRDLLEGLIAEEFTGEELQRLFALVKPSPRSRWKVGRLDPMDQFRQALGLLNADDVDAARTLMQAALVTLRANAQSTRYPGPVIALCEGLSVVAHSEEELGDSQHAADLFDEALRAADHLPEADPAHAGVMARLEALAGIARTTSDAAERNRSLARGESIAARALDEWDAGERTRQGIYITRDSRFKMSFERLQESEAETLGHLRGHYLDAAGATLRDALGRGERPHSLEQRFLTVAADANRDAIEHGIANDRCTILDRLANDAEAASALDFADACFDLLLRDLRRSATGNDRAWVAYGHARRGALADRSDDVADAAELYAAACAELDELDLVAAPIEALHWCTRAAASLGGAGEERLTAWVDCLTPPQSDEDERLSTIISYLSDRAQGTDDTWAAKQCESTLVAIDRALCDKGVRLGALGRSEDEVAVYDEVLGYVRAHADASRTR